ncbi:MAG: malto-oligosyltrehalose synthase [Parachlamydiaceae bacterium]|nr:malto-oligosyltrehalose synthase [Parachlamydiaceae bacterium]
MLHEPIATYRLQFKGDFGFEQAAEVAEYLSKLGISHLYASPYLQAVKGSNNGYNIVDPSHVNDELGGAQAHKRFCQKLHSLGLSQMIDIVPNHMAIPGIENPWWWDVLKNGPSSRYADFFDVDWDSSEDRWPNKVLLPVLEDHYGRVLENGLLWISHQEGVFTLHYQDNTFPIDSSSLVELLSRAASKYSSDLLLFLAESHARLPRPTVTSRKAVELRHRDKALLLNLLTRLCNDEQQIADAIDEEVMRINSDPNALDLLLEQQNYRLAFWKTACRDLGYRKFFDIKELAGLRIEDIEVFNAIHALALDWMHKGWVHALRIDHPDGLVDPTEYFDRLREKCPKAWIIAEKILMPGEKLPVKWPIQGTTGYDFLNLTSGLFIDSKSETQLTQIYEDFVGEQINYPTVVNTCKRLVLTDLLGSELNRLTNLFVAICEKHRRHRDYTRHELHEALQETAVYFPVYRTYLSSSTLVREEDEGYINLAIEKAMTERQDLDAELFQFLKELLLMRIEGKLESELAKRFQQLTGPGMAKGVEDTAFYRFNRFIVLNEVGGAPERFGTTLKEFHEACKIAQAQYPLRMLATTTHDAKRSEDVRARLALISEIPDRWSQVVNRWAHHNKSHRQGNLHDPNSEYFLYQTLVGAWPINLDRITQHMEKSAREAKVYTTWAKPNEVYELNLSKFITAIMNDVLFLKDLESFVQGLVRQGWLNSLAQTLIKLTAPGIPDIYQGTELWNLTLVDPDNRTTVDFNLRRNLLEKLHDTNQPEEIMNMLDEGLPKLYLIQKTLHLRQTRPELFDSKATYQPLFAQGSKVNHVIAYTRGEEAVTIVPRFQMSLDGKWANTQLKLPKGKWKNIFSGDEFDGNLISVEDVLSRFPVGLLVKVS